MKKTPDFDLQAAHRWFSVECFNSTWELIARPSRTPDEDDEMVRRAVASHWHWTQREDYLPKNASIAHWQLSRVYALVGASELAMHHGRRSLEVIADAIDIDDFFRAYAHEAMARAAHVADDIATRDHHVARARQYLDTIDEEENRKLLIDDLATLE